jgi:DNA-binding NarL/FixJ family response regulator
MLVDDHTVVRQGLRALLELHPDFDVVGEAANGCEAVALVEQIRPEVVVMDVAMPRLNGREATRQILKIAPESKVLVLSSYSDDECVGQMLKAGATGYLLKQALAGELAQAIRDVRRGVRVLSPAITSRRLAHRQPDLAPDRSAVRGRLTARETQVLQLIGSGFSNREMAVELGISVKTVEKHRQQVMNKLDIHEVAGLTRFVISQGLDQGNKRLAA